MGWSIIGLLAVVFVCLCFTKLAQIGTNFEECIFDMEFANIALVRLFQFVTVVLFTCLVVIYFGVLIFLPLDAAMLLAGIFSGFGAPEIVSTLSAIALIGYLGFVLCKMQELCEMVLSIGIEIALIGHAQFLRFGNVLESIKK